jgi:DNA-binding GntR family transcriptional regulator
MLKIKDNVSLRSQVLNQLRDFILSGKIAPEERLYEEKLAAEIGSSRTPVREALHILEREGLVESIPRVGYVVKGLDREEFEEIIEIHKAIDCLAAVWAADKMDDSVLRDLRDNIQKSKESVERGDIRKAVELDTKFHEQIARTSGRKRIYEMSQSLRSRALSCRVSSIPEISVAKRGVSSREKILQAIQTQNKKKIRQAIVSHLNDAKKDILAYSFGKEAAADKKRV